VAISAHLRALSKKASQLEILWLFVSIVSLCVFPQTLSFAETEHKFGMGVSTVKYPDLVSSFDAKNHRQPSPTVNHAQPFSLKRKCSEILSSL